MDCVIKHSNNTLSVFDNNCSEGSILNLKIKEFGFHMAPSNAICEEDTESELRRRLENELSPRMQKDKTLFKRFLRARNYDVDAAETMLRNHINWRKLKKVDTILTDYEYPKYKEVYLGQTRLGFDKDGSRIIYFDAGNIDFKGIMKIYNKQILHRYVIYTSEDDAEQMRIQSEKTGKFQEQSLYIINAENIPVSLISCRPVYDLFLTGLQMFEANYPERLKLAFVINATYVFSFVYNIVIPILSPSTAAKIKVFSKDGWKQELLKYIDPDVLPAFLGGTRLDCNGDPMCRAFMNFGEPVPEKLYPVKKSLNLINQQGVEKLIVPRKSKVEIKLEIIHPGSFIEWEFELKNHDIGFSLCYKSSANKDSETEELIPFHRIDSNDSQEPGSFNCTKRGIYLLVFDNTYSWIYQKEIFYIASIVPPKP